MSKSSPHFSPQTKNYIHIFVITFIASITAMLLVSYINRAMNQDEQLVAPPAPLDLKK